MFHQVRINLSLSLSLQGVQSPLFISCLKGNIEMVQLLVHHHAAIDQPTDVSNALYNSTSLSLFCCVLFTIIMFTTGCAFCYSTDCCFC